MNKQSNSSKVVLPNGVMFNAYPDSIGYTLSDIVNLLKRPEFKDVFSLFYILPTCFNSDLDRGFSVIDYDLNEELVSPDDLKELNQLGIEFKFDLVLNHLSVGSPQFQDMLQHGDKSPYKDFFIDWNEFWASQGEMGPDGFIIPHQGHLDKLFMRKPSLPILKVRFPDGSERPYWNTFYQEINYSTISASELLHALEAENLDEGEAEDLARIVNDELKVKGNIRELILNGYAHLESKIISYVEGKRQYLGQMDLNAKSDLVWEFYDETLQKLHRIGGKLIRLDAFAYLHKEPGEKNFFNKPGTWDYLARMKTLAEKHDLILLPEIHSEYGTGLHEEVAGEGFPIYDFFFPGLVIHAIDRHTSHFLKRWINEILDQNIQTINMLGCHDGIPVLDLKGKTNSTTQRIGLLEEKEIDAVVDNIMNRGGRVKNLFGPDGKKISYYQVNATFFSALGESDPKLLLARAIQIFMPGIPQVWYLDLFAGKNDYAAADRGGTGAHKEINRTTLSTSDIEEGLKKPIVQNQLTLLRLRNTFPAFNGNVVLEDSSEDHILNLKWEHQNYAAELSADLKTHKFAITLLDDQGEPTHISFYEAELDSQL